MGMRDRYTRAPSPQMPSTRTERNIRAPQSPSRQEERADTFFGRRCAHRDCAWQKLPSALGSTLLRAGSQRNWAINQPGRKLENAFGRIAIEGSSMRATKCLRERKERIRQVGTPWFVCPTEPLLLAARYRDTPITQPRSTIVSLPRSLSSRPHANRRPAHIMHQSPPLISLRSHQRRWRSPPADNCHATSCS